jgi:DNA-directed RNA polymerase specialized sigma24 family protein
MSRYEVEVTRSEGWWAITIPAYPGVFTQARRLEQVPAIAADALALWNEMSVEPDEVTISEVHVDPAVEYALHEAWDWQARLREAQEHTPAAMRTAAAMAAKAGLSVRDIGTLLGVSFQRAAVLVNEAA